MASITDLLDRVSDSTTGRPVVTTLASSKAIAAASVTIADATNWTTTSATHFVIYEVNANNVKQATTQTEWKAVLTGVSLSNLTLTGGIDRAYSTGAIVEEAPTSRYAKDLYDWGITHADQDGTLKAGAVDNAAVLSANVVTTDKILAANVTTAKIADGNITSAKLATSAIKLAAGANVTTSQTLSTLATDIGLTGFSVATTVPSGGRDVVVEFDIPQVQSTGATILTVKLWASTVGGTLLKTWLYKLQDSGDAKAINFRYRDPAPAAGAKTYLVSIATGTNNVTVTMSASQIGQMWAENL